MTPRGRHTTAVHARQIRLRERDVREVDGIPVTSPELTLCELAAVVPYAKLQVAVDSALRVKLTTTAKLTAAAGERLGRGTRGSARMRAVLDALGERPAGAAACELCALLAAAGVPLPVLEYPVRRPDGTMAFLDGAYPAERVVVEIDDFSSHATPGSMDDERERQNDLGYVLADWRWVRVTPRQIGRRPQWVVNTICAALRLDPARHRLPDGRRRAG